MKIHTVELPLGEPGRHEVVLLTDHGQALAKMLAERDAAQAQLARVQAELPDLRANMTKALDLLEVLTWTKYTDGSFVEAVDEADEMLEQLRGKVVLKDQADQQEAQPARVVMDEWRAEQEAQGAQAGDECFASPEEYAEARAALATQPAAGEPEQQTAINADDLPTKKYPLGAFDFDSPATAPVAAGEPVAFSTEHGALFWHGSPQDWKGKTVQLYLAPPAAAHEDEAVRKDAAAAYVAMSCNSVLIDGSTCYYLPAERMAAFDRMFSLGDAMRAQAGEGGEV